MSTADMRRRWGRHLRFGPLLGAALLLAACAAGGPSRAHGASTASPSASSAASPTATTASSSGLALKCSIANQPHGIDTVTITLTCAVSGAPASETSFALTYRVKASTGMHFFTPACAGALSGGHGSCAQRYTVPVTFDLGAGSVSGATQPSQRILGPLIPSITTSPTPIGSPLPYAPPAPGA